mgnify:CR=1 FL=1|jgi:hypothetical protein
MVGKVPIALRATEVPNMWDLPVQTFAQTRIIIAQAFKPTGAID